MKYESCKMKNWGREQKNKDVKDTTMEEAKTLYLLYNYLYKSKWNFNKQDHYILQTRRRSLPHKVKTQYVLSFALENS